MQTDLDRIWRKLEEDTDPEVLDGHHTYRGLGPEGPAGIRLGIVMPGPIREIIIQVREIDRIDELIPPRWKGMRFALVELDVPEDRTRHIRLFLLSREHIAIFTQVCTDIVDSLEGIPDNESRIGSLQACLDRWSSFFSRYGTEGLSGEAQRGLFGEIIVLSKIIDMVDNPRMAIETWKGADHSTRDFERNDRAIEVKTTMTKEPSRVIIQSERQLDDFGLTSLALYVLHLVTVERKGKSLPEIVDEVRVQISGIVNAEALFESLLRRAGYLDIHAILYTRRYLVKKEEAFTVRDGFPRITSVAPGIGDLRYSLLLSACSPFGTELDECLKSFIGVEQ